MPSITDDGSGSSDNGDSDNDGDSSDNGDNGDNNDGNDEEANKNDSNSTPVGLIIGGTFGAVILITLVFVIPITACLNLRD